MANKVCPVTREQFNKGAKAMVANIGGQGMNVFPKQFSTGSFGWYGNGKILVDIEGVQVQVQVGINMTVVGSKDSPPQGV